MNKIDANTTKCPICGGLIKIFGYGGRKCTCCNEIFNVDYKDLDKLNKANNLRHENSFTEALDLYKEILQEDPDYVEANWGALLCHFGVEYVQDNGREIPTIHRPVNNYKINENKYALNILNNTYGEDLIYYSSKIEELEELRKQIEENSRHNVKYDVFLSCKITEAGSDAKYTEEYQWADYVYKQLTNRGLKVFYSPYVLPATNGAYEPIIYSALQSSKFLIVFATTKEHLNSKWIQNEWGRYLDLRELDIKNKYFKLVIDSKKIAEKDIDDRLSEISYISHNDKKWFSQLLEATNDCFKDLDEYKDIDLNDIFIDLSGVKKPLDNLLEGLKPKARHKETAHLIESDFDVELVDLANDYTLDSNVAKCKQIVEGRIAAGRFIEAKTELKKYLDFIGDKIENLDYVIIKLKLLVDYKVPTIEELLQNEITTFKDFKLLKLMFNKMPKTDESIIDPILDYIIDSIINGYDNNAPEFYKILVDINSQKIIQFNSKLMREMRYLINKPELLSKYYEICAPYFAKEDVRLFLQLSNNIARDLCKNSHFDYSKQIVDKILKIEESNSSALLTLTLINNNAKDFDQLLVNIEENNNYFEIENIFNELNESVSDSFIRKIQNRIDFLINSEDFDKAYNWLNVIINEEFENRDTYFKKIAERCLNNYRSYKVFSLVIKTFGEDSRELFSKYCLRFIKILLKNKNFEQAKKLCLYFRQFINTNSDVFRYQIYAEIESSDFTYKNLYKLQDLSLVEQLLIIQESNHKRKQILDEMLNYCIGYIEKSDDIDENIYVVMDKLIAYREGDEILVNKIIQIGRICLANGRFDEAEWYYKKAIRYDNSSDEAYWGIILAKSGCKDNEELIKFNQPITHYQEYDKILEIVNGNNDLFNKYDDIVLKQRATLRKKKGLSKKGKIIISSIAAAVLLIIIIVLVTLFV